MPVALPSAPAAAELLAMLSSETCHRPATLLSRIAILAVILGAFLGLQASAARASSAAHRATASSGERARKAVKHRRHVRAKASSRKRHKGKPVTTEEPTGEPTPTESTTTEPTPTTTEPTTTEPAPAPEPTPEPAPAPAPEPTPEDSGSLLFSGSHIGDFWLNQSAPNAITEVNDPAGSSQKVFRMTVSDQDVYPITPTENPRAQLLSSPTIEPGDEIWWSAKFYLPGSFPSSVPGWLNLLEGPYGKPFNGSPPWQIQVVGNHIQWTRNRTYGWDVPWQMPLVKERWVSVVVHERFGSSGYVEMWIDGQPITFFSGGTYNPKGIAPTPHLNMATMDASNNGGPNMIILQSYREAGMFSSVSVFESPLKIGTSRNAVGA
jgi:outer membrane biosynthesis protein TonB